MQAKVKAKVRAKTRAACSALVGLCMAASALPALAQSRYLVTVVGDRVVVKKALDSGSPSKGVVWTLGTKGFRFGKSGATVLGTDRTFSCPPTPAGDMINCSIPDYADGKEYSFSVEVEAADGSSIRAEPAPNQWIQND
jgi:hypothetical protein